VGILRDVVFYELPNSSFQLFSSNSHLTGNLNMPTNTYSGDYVIRVIADDNTSDQLPGPFTDVPFSIVDPLIESPPYWPVDITIPTGLSFAPGQYISFYLNGLAIDVNGDDVFYRTYISENNNVSDYYTGLGRLSVNVSKNGLIVCGQYFDNARPGNYVIRVCADDNTADLNPGTPLVIPFTISAVSETGPYPLIVDTNESQGDTLLYTFNVGTEILGRLYDDDANEVLDRFSLSSLLFQGDATYIGILSGQLYPLYGVKSYTLTWADMTHWSAHGLHTLVFGLNYDDSARPTTLSVDGRAYASIDWKAVVVDGVVATVDIPAQNGGTFHDTLILIDGSDADTFPDSASYTQGTGANALTTNLSLENWNFDILNHPMSVNAIVQSSPNASELFSGSVSWGDEDTPSEITIPSVNMYNHLPQLDNGASPFLTGIVENISDENNIGLMASDIVVDGSISDRDDQGGQGLRSIAVCAVNTSSGTWQYKIGTGGAWSAFSFTGANEGTVLLLDSSDRIRFIPNTNWAGTITDGISFRAWDKSAGNAGEYMSISGNIGDWGSLSTETESASISVYESSNHIPVIIPHSFDFISREYHTGIYPLSITIADVNGDGYVDLITSNRDSNTISVLLNNGHGIFAPKVDYATGTKPNVVTSTDVNHDGAVDLITANRDRATLSVLLNNGNGTFASEVDYSIGFSPQTVTTADLNGDGYADLISANAASGTVTVLFNKGNSGAGVFDSSAVANSHRADYVAGEGPRAIAFADMDKDGDLDLVIANTGGTVTVLLNKGAGVFDASTTSNSFRVDYNVGSSPATVICADVDRDGNPDLIVANSESNTLSVLMNNGSGALFGRVDYTTGATPQSLISVDIDKDGDLDLVVANYLSGSLTLFTNDGNGHFSSSLNSQTYGNPQAVSSADVNNDGQPDLLVVNGSSTVTVKTNVSGTTSYVSEQHSVFVSNEIIITDPDGDSDWNGGTLKVQITGNASPQDVLDMPPLPLGETGISINSTLNGLALMAGSTVIGSVNSELVLNSVQWVFTFNENATNALVQEVARAIAFYNGSDNPSAATRTVRFTVTDSFGASAFCEQAISVTPINDLPTSTNESFTIDEDVSRVLTLADFGSYSDRESEPIASVKITSLPAFGGLVHYDSNGSWRPVSLGQEIAVGDIIAERLKFLPMPNSYGAQYTATIGFAVGDGIDYSLSSYAITVNLSSANDAPTFAVGTGIVTTGFPIDNVWSSLYAADVVVQPDGRIVVTGTKVDTSTDIVLARYNSDGSIDTSFGSAGQVVTNIGFQDGASSIALQSTGKIVVAGYTLNAAGSETDFTLVRYNSDGSIDTSFGTNGVVTTDIVVNDTATSMTMQSDGKIVVAGFGDDHGSESGSQTDFVLVRYNSDGTIDTGFGKDGKVITDIFGNDDKACSTRVLSSGTIIVVGSTVTETGTDIALVCYKSDGTLDTSFGGDGIVTTDISADGLGAEYANSVAVQSTGKIVVAGNSHPSSGPGTDILLVRYNTDGSLDTSFGTAGKVITDIGVEDFANSIALQSNGKIVIAGYSLTDTGNHIILERFSVNGILDASFGNGGKVITAIGDNDFGFGLKILESGQIVVAGSSDNDIAVVRYNSNGTLDQSFGSASNTLDAMSSYTENGPAVVLDDNVQILDIELASSGGYAGSTLDLVRHNGVNVDDHFSGKSGGTLAVITELGCLTVNGTTIGIVIGNTVGHLSVLFNDAATQALVNEALQQIAYSNSSDTPPASVQIDWTFSDGNTTLQGFGGIASVTASTTVAITAVNDAAQISGTRTQDLSESDAVLSTGGTLTATDVDSASTFVAQTDVSGSNNYGKFSIDNAGVWSYTASSAHNEFVNGVNYADSLTVSTADGTTQILTVTIIGTNDAPIGSNDSVTVHDTGNKVLGVSDLGVYSDEEGEIFDSVIITTIPTSGSLQYDADETNGENWVEVTGRQVISADAIDAGRLRFVSGLATTSATITFSVSDGSAESVSTYTLTIYADRSQTIDASAGQTIAGTGLTAEVPDGVSFVSQELIETGVPLGDQLSVFADQLIVDPAVSSNVHDVIDSYITSLGGLESEVNVRAFTLEPIGDYSIVNPVIISGDDSGQEALVIDARHLPTGTVLDLNNVEFAIIIGPTHLEGGEGSNIIIADGSNQYIVLGPDDDTINGGAGNDTVGSLGGNDLLDGGTGNDTVTYLTVLAGVHVDLAAGTASSLGVNDPAGIGHDTIVNIENIIGSNYSDLLTGDDGDNAVTGGGGNDTIDGGEGSDTAVYDGNYENYVIGYNAGTDAYTIYDRTAGRDGSDKLRNVESFDFNGTTKSVAELHSDADMTAPTLTSFTPADSATGVAITDNIVLKFSETVQRGTGLIEIHSGSAGGTLVESFDAATSSHVSISGDTLNINPEGNLLSGTEYYVTFSDGSVSDLVGNHYSGTSAYHFSTVAAAYAGTGGDGGSSGGSGGAAAALVGAAGLGVIVWLVL
jgi:uncharacterized delta-60 repeat protein